MKLSCPACGFIADPDGFLAERDELAGIAAALSLPAPLSGPLMQYLRLFRPQQRALTTRRLRGLLGELLPPIRDAKLAHDGRLWSAPLPLWTAALEAMLAKRDAGKLRLPLKSHGYLFEIVVGLAGAAESGVEKQSEDRRAGRTPAGAAERSNVEMVDSLPPRPRGDSAVVRNGLQSLRAVIGQALPEEGANAD